MMIRLLGKKIKFWGKRNRGEKVIEEKRKIAGIRLKMIEYELEFRYECMANMCIKV